MSNKPISFFTSQMSRGMRMRESDRVCLRSVVNIIDHVDADIHENKCTIGFGEEAPRLLIHVRDKLCSYLHAELDGEIYALEQGDKIKIDHVGPVLCRGVTSVLPYDMLDECAYVRIYNPCLRPVQEGELPYCSVHRNTFAARYRRAVIFGDKNLLSDEEVKIAGPHTLYFNCLLRKVGITKHNRLLMRASEQLHTVFIPLRDFLDVNTAIILEKQLVQKLKGSEVTDRVPLKRKLQLISNNPLRLKMNNIDMGILVAAMKLVDALGNVINAYNVRMDIDMLRRAKYEDASNIKGTLVFEDFIAGFLVFRDHRKLVFTEWKTISDREIRGCVVT